MCRPTHTRRFSKEGGALGSRKWAWRRQSSDPAPSASEGDPGEGKEDSGQAVSRGEVTREASRGSFFSAPSREHSLASGGTPEVGGLLGGRRTALGSPAGAEGRYMRELQAVAALEVRNS